MERDVREPLTYRRLRANEVGTERQPSGPEIYAELIIDELATATDYCRAAALSTGRSPACSIIVAAVYRRGTGSERAFRGDRQ